MRKLKMGLLLAVLGLLPLLGRAPLALGADTTIDIADVASSAGYEEDDLTSVIGTLINIVLGLLGIILLVIVIYAGFLWMTAGGNTEQVEKAKAWMINAVIGLILVLAAYAISTFVIDALTEAGLSTS